MILRLWERSLPLVRERVASLEEAAAKAECNSLSLSDRAEAASLAHKLAGSLGMFGYPQGTDVARELEQMLEADAPLSGELFRSLTVRLRAALHL